MKRNYSLILTQTICYTIDSGLSICWDTRLFVLFICVYKIRTSAVQRYDF